MIGKRWAQMMSEQTSDGEQSTVTADEDEEDEYLVEVRVERP
jgi:hypothetical protein